MQESQYFARMHSESDPSKVYIVSQKLGSWSCTCTAGQFGRQCKHIRFHRNMMK